MPINEMQFELLQDEVADLRRRISEQDQTLRNFTEVLSHVLSIARAQLEKQAEHRKEQEIEQ